MLRSSDAPAAVEPGARVARSKQRRRAVLGALALLAGGGIVAAVGAVSRSFAPTNLLAGSRPLPDGSVVMLEQVTFGRTHRLGTPRKKFAWMPDWLAGANRHVPSIEIGTSVDSLMLWITHRHPAAPGKTRSFEWWADYHLLDSHGCRFDHYSRELRTQGKQSSSSASLSRGDRFTPQSLSDPTALSVGIMNPATFPRREPAMTLRLFGAEWGKAAEFIIPNPVPTSYPEWDPLPLPQQQLDGDLTMQLTSVTGVLDEWDSNGVTTRQQRLRPSFKILQRGQETDAWSSDEIRVSDATGNEANAYDCRLCLREKAWRMRVRTWRKPHAAFTPEETWVVRDVPVEGAGKFRRLSGSATRHNVKLELLGIAGRGAYSYKDGIPGAGERPLPADEPRENMGVSGSTRSGASGRHTDYHLRAGTPHVGVRVTGLPEEYHLDLVAIDARGRQIPSENRAQMDSEYYLGLDLPRDARTVRLNFMVHRCRTAEFLIRPPEFRKAKR